MNTLLIFIGLGVSTTMLLRLTLILTGQIKGPVLAHFQRYGDLEGHFYPLTDFLFWLAGFVFFGGHGLRRSIEVQLPIGLTTIVLLICAYYAHLAREWIRGKTRFLAVLPSWSYRLHEVTTRHERRRIAYMWLRLPMRTRLLYNANTHAFEVWAEMVILATL